MKADLLKRLEVLEGQIKSAAESPLWVDGHNATVRVDINGKRGKPMTFDTCHLAAVWLESQIDGHPHAAGSYSVDRLFDLYREPDKLLDTLTAALEGRVINVHGMTYSVESWPGFLFGQLKTGAPADLKLWLLANGALLYFDTREFRARLESGEFTDDDAAMFAACYVMFAWERPGASPDDLWRLIEQVCARKPPEPPVAV